MTGESRVATWPPTPEQRQHLVTLARFIKRFGAARFTATPLVRADTRDFPDPWQPTLAALHRVLYRLYWHAHVDAEIAIEDVRPAKPPDYKMLQTSTIELGKVDAGRVSYHVEKIGNDDVAGLLSHTVGAAFLELAPTDPFRDQQREASDVEASIAAVYLGLGVLVANASMYRRHASKVVGRSVLSEDLIAVTGGLSIGDATMLLAVQDALRDEVQDALATLHAPQTEWLARWREVLEPHEDELRALLELDDAAGELPARAVAPREPAATPAERDLRKFNAGKKTFRVVRRKRGRSSLGVIVGAFGFALPFGWYIGPAAMIGGLFAGHYLAGRVFECADPKCTAVMTTEVDICPRCGGTIVETLAHAGLRLDRLEELEGDPGFDYGQHDERRADV